MITVDHLEQMFNHCEALASGYSELVKELQDFSHELDHYPGDIMQDHLDRIRHRVNEATALMQSAHMDKEDVSRSLYVIRCAQARLIARSMKAGGARHVDVKAEIMHRFGCKDVVRHIDKTEDNGYWLLKEAKE